MTIQAAVRITDDSTRAEIEEALVEHVKTMRRWPAHWSDRRAAMHVKIDALLEDWMNAPESRSES